MLKSHRLHSGEVQRILQILKLYFQINFFFILHILKRVQLKNRNSVSQIIITYETSSRTAWFKPVSVKPESIWVTVRKISLVFILENIEINEFSYLYVRKLL